MSVAVFEDPDGGHLPLLKAGIVVLEGINLECVEPGDYQLIALPLKLGGREGAPHGQSFWMPGINLLLRVAIYINLYFPTNSFHSKIETPWFRQTL